MRAFLAAIVLGLMAAPSLAAGLNVVVILDNSGSMNEPMQGGTRMEAAKRALTTVLEKAPADARVGVVQLNPPRIGQDWLVPLGPVDSAEAAGLVRAVRPGGPTPLGDAVKRAADALLAAREAQRYGDYQVLFVTDGEATDKALLNRYLPEAQARGLLVDVIGVDMGSDHSLAARCNSYRNATDLAALEAAISAVVLGESDDSASDTGESDFELIAPLPDELAVAALMALGAPSNGLIGEGNFRPAANEAVFPPAGANNQQPPAGQGGGGRFTLGPMVLVGVFFLFLLLGKALKSSR